MPRFWPQFVILISLWAASSQALANATTFSEVYSGFNVNSAERAKFIGQQNDRTNTSLHSSPNFAPIRNFLQSIGNEPYQYFETQQAQNTTVTLVDEGLGYGAALFENVRGEKRRLLYLRQLGLGGRIDLTLAKLSKDKSKVAMILTVDGSIGELHLIVYDLLEKRIVYQPEFRVSEAKLIWVGPTNFLVSERLADSTSQYVIVDFAQDIVVPRSPGEFFDSSVPGWEMYNFDRSLTIADGANTYFFERPTDYWPLKLMGANGSEFFILEQNETPSIYKGKAGTRKLEKLMTFSQKYLSAPFMNENFFGFLESNPETAGESRVLLFSRTQPAGTAPAATHVFTLPNGVWVQRGQLSEGKLHLFLKSPFNKGRWISHTAGSRKWANEFKSLMRDEEGREYTIDTVLAKSADGTTIPARVARMLDGKEPKNRPVFMQTYAGFNSAPFFSGVYNVMAMEFMRRGGLVVWPAPRGGAELGRNWWMAARGPSLKPLTYADLAAVARELVTNGMSAPEKIIAMGSSNGGLTVTATALLYPGTFGLVISNGGVLDVLGIGKLDGYYGKSWMAEYGDPEKDAAAIAKFSPLELVTQQGSTRFLLVAGRGDERVNLVHSVKLARGLIEHGGAPENVNLFVIENAGHFVLSSQHSEGIRWWFANTAVWTKIFDQAGLTF